MSTPDSPSNLPHAPSRGHVFARSNIPTLRARPRTRSPKGLESPGLHTDCKNTNKTCYFASRERWAREGRTDRCVYTFQTESRVQFISQHLSADGGLGRVAERGM